MVQCDDCDNALCGNNGNEGSDLLYTPAAQDTLLGSAGADDLLGRIRCAGECFD